MNDPVLTNFLGLLVGMVASFLTWWILFHWFVPNIEISAFISKVTREGGSGYSYRIKLKNTGRRSILGVEVYARLWTDWKGNGNWVGIYLPFTGEGDKKYDLPVLKVGGNRVLSFFLNAVPSFQTNARYPVDFKAKASTKIVTMEDVLALGKEAYVQVFVSGFDSFSGARRVFESKRFSASDIHMRRFKKDGLGLGESSVELPRASEETNAVAGSP